MTRRPGIAVSVRRWGRLALVLLVGGSLLACSPPAHVDDPADEDPSGRAAEARFWEEYRAATADRRAGRRAAAIAGYEAALELRSQHADSLYYTGQLRYARGEVGAAVDYLRRLAELEPRGLRAWQQLSVVLGTPRPGWVPDLGAATAAARRAIALNPSESRSHLLLGRWAAYAGEPSVAVAELETALGYNPGLDEASMLLAWLDASGAEERVSVADAIGRLRAAAVRDVTVRLGREPRASTLRALEMSDGSVVLVHRGESAEESVLPGCEPVPGWPSAMKNDGVGGPIPVPWRAVRLRGGEGPELWIAGGGARPLRRYVPGPTGAWEEAAAAGFPERLPGSVVAPIDVDGDGRDEIFVANVLVPDTVIPRPPATEDTFGVLLGAGESGAWVARSEALPGPWSAATAIDADDDGDADLIVARDLDASGGGPPTTGEDEGEAGAEGSPAVVLFRNDDGRLRREAGVFPVVRVTIRDFRSVTVAGDVGLYLATGGLTPESGEADMLWVRRNGRWVDVSHRLQTGREGRTFRVIGARPTVLLRRGGLVPADGPAWAPLRLASPQKRAE